MPMAINKWILWLLLILVIQISASSLKYQPVFNQAAYLLDAILQVQAVDLNNDQRAELLLAGKNYIGRELFVYCLEFSKEGKPAVKWRSNNLFEENSVLWLAVGNFSGIGRQLLVMTRSQYYCYDLDNATIKLSGKGKTGFEPLGMTAADVDGDSLTELIVVKPGSITGNAYNCTVEIRKQTGEKFAVVYQSGPLGNIRAITTGDLGQDGRTAIVLESGLRLESGVIRLYHFNNRQLSSMGDFKPVNGGAIYALKVRSFSDGIRLVTGSTQGKINQCKWVDGLMTPAAPELNLKSSLVDLEVADLNGDTKPELITIGYPAKLTIGTLQ